jgi:hypothetical protein
MFNTSGSFAAATTLVASSGAVTVRKFAVAYEQTSGHCMVAYSTGTGKKVDYRTATGGVLGSAATVFSTSALATDCVRLAAKPSSDEIMLLAVDYNADLRASIWSGSAWGSVTTPSTNVDSAYEESFAGAYENTSGDGLMVYGNTGVSTPYYRTYTSGTWSAQSSMTACSNTPQYIRMASKPGSDEIVCGILDNNGRIRMYIWNGSSWASNLEITTSAFYTDRRPFDVAYSPDGSKALVVYGINTNIPQYRTYSGGSWSSATAMTDMGSTPQWVQVIPGSSGGEMFVAIANAGLDLNLWKWSGTAMGTMSTVETNLGGSNTTEQFWLMGPKSSPTITSWENVDPGP